MKTPTMSRRTICGWAVLALVAVAGCGGGSGGPAEASPSDSPLVAAATEEGTLTWYSGENQAFNERVADAFQQRYGIEVESIRAVSADLEQRYSTERQSGQVVADVMNTGTPGFYSDGLASGWFEPLAGQDIPSLKAWPSEYTTEASAVISITPFVLGYNTDLVRPDQVPATWAEVLSPANRERLMLLDPRAAAAYMSHVQMWVDTLGPEFVRQLGAARPTLIQSSVPGAQALAAGEDAFLFPTLGNFLQTLIDDGAPIGMKVLDPTTGVEQHMALSTNAAHPNAAKLFLDWILSPEGQSVVVDPTKASPANAATLPSGYLSPDVPKATANRERLIELLQLR